MDPDVYFTNEIYADLWFNNWNKQYRWLDNIYNQEEDDYDWIYKLMTSGSNNNRFSRKY